jgi:hypothetical protein
VLWDDGQVQKIPFDKILLVPMGDLADALKKGGSTKEVIKDFIRRSANIEFTFAYPGQAGMPPYAITYDEYYNILSSIGFKKPKHG